MSCNCTTYQDSKEILSKVLANTYVLYLKTQNVHWNVKGVAFREIHLMTEEHYNNLFLAIDEIAERLRMIGERAPATFSEFTELACLSDKLESKNSDEMLTALLDDHKSMAAALKKMLGFLGNSDDFGTIDLLNVRLKFHEKTVWMLSSTLNN